MQAFIPRKLDDVVDFERDLDCVREGIDTDLVWWKFCLVVKIVTVLSLLSLHETEQYASKFHLFRF